MKEEGNDVQDINQLRIQIKEIVSSNKDTFKQTHQRMESLEKENSQLGTEVSLLKQDQSKILSSLFSLESRYKEIIEENKQIKNELLDFRKNRPVITKLAGDNACNMPLSKSSLIHDSLKDTASNFYTPAKIEDKREREVPVGISSSLFGVDTCNH